MPESASDVWGMHVKAAGCATRTSTMRSRNIRGRDKAALIVHQTKSEDSRLNVEGVVCARRNFYEVRRCAPRIFA
eukprot:1765705-Pleurochrysis_carterae.AAC.1